MTDFRALCAELLADYEDSFVVGQPGDDPLVQRARAALAQPEPQEQVLARVVFDEGGLNFPSDVVLRQYCDDWFNSNPERTEVDPVDLCRGAIRLFAHGAVAQPEPQASGEVAELVVWLRYNADYALQKAATATFKRFHRAADLLEQLDD